MDIEKESEEFEWDKWNTDKNWQKHRVKPEEAEQPFFDENKFTSDDIKHSYKEKRIILLGKTKKGRLLYIVYTLRKDRIRIISARDTNKKEEKFYEKTVKNTKV